MALSLVLSTMGGCASPAAVPSQPAPSTTARPSASAAATPRPSATATPAPTPAVTPLPATAVVRVPVATGPNPIARSSDRVWVEVHRDDTLASIDPSTLAVTRYPDIPVHCAIASDGGGTVWATIAAQSRVTKVDATTGKSLVTTPLPDACGIGVTKDQVWVTSPGEGTIVQVDPKTAKVVRAVDVEPMPFLAQPIGKLVYASGEGGGGWLRAYDIETGELVAERTSTEQALIDELALGFGSLWGTARTDQALVRFAPDTLAVEGSVPIGAEPSGVAATEDAIWVTQLGGRLVRVDPATMTVTHTWALDARWVAWPVIGFGRLWLSALEDDAVLGIDLDALVG